MWPRCWPTSEPIMLVVLTTRMFRSDRPQRGHRTACVINAEEVRLNFLKAKVRAIVASTLSPAQFLQTKENVCLDLFG
jgi:hypothetical protein